MGSFDVGQGSVNSRLNSYGVPDGVLESTKVSMEIPGIKAEVSWSVKELGLERADALRRSSTEAPTRSTQPWSSAGAGGLLPILLAPWWRSCCPGLSPQWRHIL